MATVAAVIIGDEILTGKFRDENGPFLIDHVRALGAELRRIAVVPDVPEVIAAEVRHCSEAFDVVITSGGVGPTHDDLTLESVALAFGLPLEEREELLALMDHYGIARDEATLRMARVPVGTDLLWGGEAMFPVMRVRNVHVLPGVPKLFRDKLRSLDDVLRGQALYTGRVRTDRRESSIANELGLVAERHPLVQIGSYPRYDDAEHHVIVTFESRSLEALAACEAELRAWLVAGPTDPANQTES